MMNGPGILSGPWLSGCGHPKHGVPANARHASPVRFRTRPSRSPLLVILPHNEPEAKRGMPFLNGASARRGQLTPRRAVVKSRCTGRMPTTE